MLQKPSNWSSCSALAASAVYFNIAAKVSLLKSFHIAPLLKFSKVFLYQSKNENPLYDQQDLYGLTHIIC